MHAPSRSRDSQSPGSVCSWESRSAAEVSLELAVILLPQLLDLQAWPRPERATRVGISAGGAVAAAKPSAVGWCAVPPPRALRVRAPRAGPTRSPPLPL